MNDKQVESCHARNIKAALCVTKQIFLTFEDEVSHLPQDFFETNRETKLKLCMHIFFGKMILLNLFPISVQFLLHRMYVGT